MKTAIKTILWTAAAVLLVVVVVVAVRLLTRPPTLSEDIFREVPKLGMRVRPDLKQAEVVIPGRPHPLPFLHNSEEYKARITKRLTFRCSTNAFGHRGGPIAAKPTPGTTRILAYGDSITFGYGVDDGLSYPAVLQKLLDKQGKFEVINAGNPGEPSHAGARVLKRLIIPLQPHIVLICLGTNDIVNHFKRGNAETIYHPAAYDRIGYYIEGRLKEMITLLRKHKIKAGVVLPPLTSFYPFPEYRRTLDVIAAMGKKLNVPVFDLEKTFRQQERQDGLVLHVKGLTQALVKFENSEPRQLFTVKVKKRRPLHISEEVYTFLDKQDVAQALSIDESHPNPRGHRLIAQILAEGVLKMVAQ